MAVAQWKGANTQEFACPLKVVDMGFPRAVRKIWPTRVPVEARVLRIILNKNAREISSECGPEMLATHYIYTRCKGGE